MYCFVFIAVSWKIRLFYYLKISLSLDFVLSKTYHFYCCRTETSKKKHVLLKRGTRSTLVSFFDKGIMSGAGHSSLHLGRLIYNSPWRGKKPNLLKYASLGSSSLLEEVSCIGKGQYGHLGLGGSRRTELTKPKGLIA